MTCDYVFLKGFFPLNTYLGSKVVYRVYVLRKWWLKPPQKAFLANFG